MKSLNNFKAAHKVYLKTSLILIASLLGVLYVFFSYYQTSTNTKNHNQNLLLQEQKILAEAFHHFQQFLSLTESRLLNSLSKPEAIPSILSGHIAHLMGKTFPEILSMAFIPASAPHTRYTIFGKSLSPVEEKTDSQKSHEYLGNGTFKVSKVLYDDGKKAFGMLQSTFSISALLYRNFSEDEIEIIHDQGKILNEEQLVFKISNLPYIFVLNREIPSFLQFLWSFKLQALFTLFFGMTLLFIGVTTGISFNRKKLIRQHSLYKNLEGMHVNLEKKTQNLETQLIDLQNLVKFKEQSKEGIHLLFNMVQERYQKMAMRTQAINAVTSNLILEEAENDKLLQKIHDVSQESTLVLRHLMRGFLMKDDAEEVNVIDCLEKIKTIFLPEMITRKSTFEIQEKLKENFLIDKNILEIVLHNIFNMIIDRLNKNNFFKIVITEKDSLQLMFLDNGYDIGERMQKVQPQRAPENILRLQKNELREFICHLGWTLSFQEKSDESLNVIKLLIPRELSTQPFSTNVVNFSNFKARTL